LVGITLKVRSGSPANEPNFYCDTLVMLILFAVMLL
jgi:hypothetical protein